MKLHILFGQREEAYAGQYAPEALVCWDEFSTDENPGAFEHECEEYLQEHKDEFAATRVILVEVDGDEIARLLIKAPTIEGNVTS